MHPITTTHSFTLKRQDGISDIVIPLSQPSIEIRFEGAEGSKRVQTDSKEPLSYGFLGKKIGVTTEKTENGRRVIFDVQSMPQS